ncbi:MAG: hypothetical protein ABR923_00055 [Terracidiphilus sp.]
MTDADQNKSEGETRDTPQNSPAPGPSQPVNRIVFYALVVTAFGILAGIAIAAISLHQSKTAISQPVVQQPTVSREVRDLGAAEESTTGLKGHLTTQWSDQPTYHVTIEPGDATMAAGFALALSEPPHPLSIQVQLKDRLGYVMCSHDVLLRFLPRKPADLEPPDPKLSSGKKTPIRKISAKEQERRDAEQTDFDHALAQEQQREQGKDVFQNQTGPDGQVISISAQGTIPCPLETYQRVETWGFVPDFPTLDEQADLLGNQPEAKEAALHAARAARRRIVYKSPDKTLSFSFEGDDAVVDFDVPGGVLETRAGKTFLIDKSPGVGNTAVWQEYPAYFHYRCEQTTSTCTLARAGAGVMHGKLKR